MASKEPQSGCFTITKDNWGYTEIRLRTDCEFIKLSKPVLTHDDFIGKTYLYSISSMHLQCMQDIILAVYILMCISELYNEISRPV